jgi:hypothetical protein
VAHAWMPEASRIRAETDGGPLTGGAPRAVWLTLGATPGAVSVQSAAARLIGERRPCHLIWDPLTGDLAQLISVLRAGRALGAADYLDWSPDRGRAYPDDVNHEGRVCVQIGVLGHPAEPFTGGALVGVEAIVSWLDSWGVPRRWPAGRPEGYRDAARDATAAAGGRRSRAEWARGGHFGASQVPRCENAGPGAIDIIRITGPHGLRSRGRAPARAEADALAIPALFRRTGRRDKEAIPHPAGSAAPAGDSPPLGPSASPNDGGLPRPPRSLG